MRIHAGMLLANVQETTALWRDERLRIAIKTYNALEREIFRKIGPAQFPQEYATLLARRAILYRERGSAYLKDSQQQFHLLEEHMGKVGANRLQAAYRVQKMHLFAVQGDKVAWEHERVLVAQWVKRQTEDREAIQGTFDYILGVGYKRFMWHLRLNQAQRNARNMQKPPADTWAISGSTQPLGPSPPKS